MQGRISRILPTVIGLVLLGGMIAPISAYSKNSSPDTNKSNSSSVQVASWVGKWVWDSNKKQWVWVWAWTA